MPSLPRTTNFVSSGPAFIISFLLVFLILPDGCKAAPHVYKTLQNVTVPLPADSRYDASEHLLCTPSTWKTVTPFFLANYFAHVATVRTLPGESTFSTVSTMAIALLFPAYGLSRGLNAIYQWGRRGKTPLEVACKSGALCVVVRTPFWEAADGTNGAEEAQNPELFTSASRAHEKTRLENTSRTESPAGSAKENKTSSQQAENSNNMEQKASADPVYTEEAGPPPEKQAIARLSALSTNPGKKHLKAWFQSRRNRFLYFKSSPFRPATRWFSLVGRTVHGACDLPRGYALAVIPPTLPISRFKRLETVGPAIVPKPWYSMKISRRLKDFATVLIDEYGLDPPNALHIDGLSMSWSLSQAVVAVLQIVYAAFTLYETQGDQLKTYGYAAFGLTVTPYLVMSLINLVGNILTPGFSSVYLIRDQVMIEVEEKTKTRFGRVVGELEKLGEEDGQKLMLSETVSYSESLATNDIEKQNHTRLMLSWLNRLIALTPLAVVAALTRFKEGHSTFAQRAWTMTWLAFGILVGSGLNPTNTNSDLVAQYLGDSERERERRRERLPSIILLGSGIFYSAPAIGGLVVVGQMLNAYGDCKKLY